ncbi:protein kinase [Rhodococcus hoagii]|nr:protein kinase [Prescottella equi]
MTEYIQLTEVWKVIGPIGDTPGMSEVIEVENSGQRAVVKRIKKIEGGNRDLLVTELGDCRNILPFDEVFDDDSDWLLRMPKAEMSLNQRLRAVGKFTEDDTLAVLRDVATTLHDMGSAIVHRDIKPQNILRYNDAWCLADFGIARYAEEATATLTYKMHGSEPWLPPERWRLERATIKSDVYSLGVVAFQLLTGQLPFSGPDLSEQHRNSAPPALDNVAPLLKSLVQSMLAKSPEARPNPSQILDRLNVAAKPVRSAAMSSLYQLAGEASERKAAADAAASAAQTKRDQRRMLAESALMMAPELFDPIVEALSAIPGMRVQTNSRAKEFSFESANLVIEAPIAVDANPAIPFDVVCTGRISVEMTGVRDRWAGRSHSIWYCDAQNEGEYYWYETAFHNLRANSRLEPYSRAASGRDTEMALQRVMHTEQVAVGFTALVGEAVDEFVERWIDRFAQAARDQLPRPMVLPEGTVQGTWRN